MRETRHLSSEQPFAMRARAAQWRSSQIRERIERSDQADPPEIFARVRGTERARTNPV